MDFKTIAFIAVVVFGVPAVAAACIFSGRLRGWVTTLMVFSLALADKGNINFMSQALYRGPDRGFEIALTDILAWGIGISLMIRRGRYRILPPNSLVMVLYFIIALLSVRGSPEPLLSAFTVFKMVRAFILFVVCYNLARRDDSLAAVWRGLVGIAAYIGYLAVTQKYLQGIYRIHTAFDHSNSVPLFINQFLPVLVAMLFVVRGSLVTRVITMGAALAMLFTVVMTFSRAGMVLAAFSVVVVLLFANFRLKTKFVKMVTVATFAGMMVGGGAAAGSIIARFLEAPESSAEARHEFNNAAKRMAADNFNGIGLNQFSLVLTKEQKYRKDITVMGNESVAGVCHHVYLLTAAETGWIGMAAFILMVVGFLIRQGRGTLKLRGGPGVVAFAFFCGAGALALSGMLEWVFKTNAILNMYMVCCGISLGYIEWAKSSAMREKAAAELAAASSEDMV